MDGTYSDIVLLFGNANRALSEEISQLLDIPLCATEIKSSQTANFGSESANPSADRMCTFLQQLVLP
jgi:hypothetical protein